MGGHLPAADNAQPGQSAGKPKLSWACCEQGQYAMSIPGLPSDTWCAWPVNSIAEKASEYLKAQARGQLAAEAAPVPSEDEDGPQEQAHPAAQAAPISEVLFT